MLVTAAGACNGFLFGPIGLCCIFFFITLPQYLRAYAIGWTIGVVLLTIVLVIYYS